MNLRTAAPLKGHEKRRPETKLICRIGQAQEQRAQEHSLAASKEKAWDESKKRDDARTPIY